MQSSQLLHNSGLGRLRQAILRQVHSAQLGHRPQRLHHLVRARIAHTILGQIQNRTFKTYDEGVAYRNAVLDMFDIRLVEDIPTKDPGVRNYRIETKLRRILK